LVRLAITKRPHFLALHFVRLLLEETKMLVPPASERDSVRRDHRDLQTRSARSGSDLNLAQFRSERRRVVASGSQCGPLFSGE
jgi:hypothetical protein